MKKGFAIVSVVAVSLLQAQASRADELSPAPAVSAPSEPAPVADKAAESPAKKASTFREPGRFGAVGAITSDGFQFGGARLGEHYEAVLTVDASFATLKGAGGSGSGGDMGVTLRGGPRIALGQYNYLSLGVQGHTTFFGRDSGVSTEGSFAVGPYVGVSRHFAGAPLVITLWVQPYAYDHAVINDGDGKSASLNTHAFFQGGGFGLTYLF